MKIFYVLIFFCICSFQVYSQDTYLVMFKDKQNSPYSINQPSAYLSTRSIQRRSRFGIKITERDLPPNDTYIQTLKNLGVKVLYKSRWLNAVLVQNVSTTLAAIDALPFVKGTYTQGNLQSTGNSPTTDVSLSPFGLSQTQNQIMGTDVMQSIGLHGENMQIALIDAGFYNANKHRSLHKLFSENRVLGTWDFVDNEANVYNDEMHGTMVLSTLAGYTPDTLIGTAYNASYLLLRSEIVSSESRREEANWLFAAEKADSVGVDVISSSLGYSLFDSTAQNYTYANMNGHYALSSQAASWAAQTGMLVVVAAGNSGNTTWHYITAPSDADSIIAVGAVWPNGYKASFSGFGPTSDGRIKPDLVSQGVNVVVVNPMGDFFYGAGTSFAAPLLAGLATGYWQANPGLNAYKVIQNLKKSASQATNPDNSLGYGIPNFMNAMKVLSGCTCAVGP